MRILAPRWKAMSEEEREPYKCQARKRRRLESDDKRQLRKWIREKRRRRERRRPYAALSPYMFFVKETRLKVTKDNPNFSFMEIGQHLGQLWRNMTDVQKKHKTIMTMEDIQFDEGLDEKTFTQRYLKRRVRVD